MNMLTPLHIRLLQEAANRNITGLSEKEMADDEYTATRELYWGGYLTIMSYTYYASDKGLTYLQDLRRREKWNAAVAGKGGKS